MANTFRDADNNEQYFKTIDGDGSIGDPYVEAAGILDSAGNEVIGTTTTAAVTSDANGSVIGFLRGLVKWAYERMPTSLGQKAKTASLAVTLASDEDIVKAEDAVHGSGDKGVMSLAVRKDTAAALAGTDGDYIPLVVDASGRLHVNIGSLLGLTSRGQTTKANSIPVVIPSDQVISAGSSFYSYHVEGGDLQASPAASYVAGDCVGVKVEMTNVANSKGVRLDSIMLQAAGAGTGTWDMTVLLFDSDPSSTTFTDDAALTINTADIDKLEAYVPVSNADWKTIGTRKYVNYGNLNKVIASSGSVWLAIMAGASFDGPANNLEISVGFTQD